MKCFSSVFSQSSLVPLAKIANAPSRSLRLLWAIVTAIMFIGLCVCISLVVMQYLKHQTVFQLDYSGRHTVYDQVPGITICPQSQESKRLFNDAMKRLNITSQPLPLPWFSKSIMDSFRAKALEIQPDLKFGVIVHRLPKGELLWNTSKTAISPIYRMLLNFSVEFQIQPSYLSDSYRLTVMEQVPNIRNFLCTTFELRSKHVEKSWSYLEIRINQESSTVNTSRVTFILITHERGELPFSAYDRHIHTILPPETSVSLYFSKSVTTRLNTARNPCHVGADAKFIASELTMDTESDDSNNIRLNSVNSQIPSETSKSTLNDGIEDYSLSAFSNSNTNIYDENADVHQRWYLDYLDTLRMKNKKTLITDTTNYLQQALSRFRKKTTDQRRSKSSTVSLFGTEFLYSREACGWAECCAKVAYSCNCTCTLDLLSINRSASQTHFICERSQCQDEQIPYETCPLPCIQTKFIKHSEVRLSGVEDGLPISTSRLKLVRSESVQVATEEEIFSLAKLFSEVGGLCSLFIGFSCIFLFELLEALILMHYPKEKQTIKVNNKNNVNNGSNSNSSSSSSGNGSNTTKLHVSKHNNQRDSTQSFIQKNEKRITIPNTTTDCIVNSIIATANNNDNSSCSSCDTCNINKACTSNFNALSKDEYHGKVEHFSTRNKYFNGVDSKSTSCNNQREDLHTSSHDKNAIPLNTLHNTNDTNNRIVVNEKMVSSANGYSLNSNEIIESSHVYMLPIRLNTTISLHKIIENHGNCQIKSTSLNTLKHRKNSIDKVGQDYICSEAITICSREELIELLHQNRIRIKVM
ncbi:unnamed protein product [Heterobilharzia americana]|nr:unnamed protein product [Heterobilharzia americana]